ncbi:hypothetical protein Ancab_018305 [Ancistrocladus abbreviatus]
MQNQQYCPGNVVLPLENQVGNDGMQNAFAADLPLGTKLTRSVHGLKFQPSEICPKNFIIVDQTNDRSQVMFHPNIAGKFSYPGLDVHATCTGDHIDRKFANDEKIEFSSSIKDDLKDIDALLSLDDYLEESDEEVISTAHTHGYDGSSSPDSCSSNYSKARKIRDSSSSQRSSVGCSSCSGMKQKKMQKMVQILREIVPGGDQMNTVALLDEAVRYLKSLKVEALKLGVESL